MLLRWWASVIKNTELDPKFKIHRGRVVLRGDIVQDASGSHAVFTERRSSASQTTAAKVMDVTARQPECAGQAADAVSAYTQVKMEDTPKLLKPPKSECPDFWIRPPRHKWPKSWSSIEDLLVPLERNLYGHPLAGLLWERQFEEVRLELRWEKSTELGMPIRASKARTISIAVRGWRSNGWKKTSILCGRNWWNWLNWENRHHFLTMKTWDVLNVNAKRTKVLLRNTKKDVRITNFCYRNCKNCQGGRNLTQTRSLGHTIWKDMLKSALRDIANWRTKNRAEVQSLNSLLGWPLLQEGGIGEISKVCSQVVLKCLFLTRIGGLDLLWSVNELARAVTKWTRACGERLARPISYIHHTNDHRQYCHVGNTAQHCRLGLFQDSDFAGGVEDSKSTSGGICCILGSRTFCSHKLYVPEANISISQFNRIRSYFVVCWFTDGRTPCSWFMGSGNWSVCARQAALKDQFN